MKTKPELLAPAGDLEKLKAAITFGADAVYLGGKAFGMRASAAKFDWETMAEGLKFAHEHGAKGYVTVNTIPHNKEIDALAGYLSHLVDMDVDGIIVADLGAFALAKECAPKIPLHVSVQANITNYASAREWARMGAKRLILSREISLSDVKRIREELPLDVELEVFVHGAMCLSTSGRCYLSSYLCGRDANHGECAQPCRSQYHLVEERRPEQFMPVFEDEQGAYLLNANDLCMIEHIPDMVEAGISSFKIEGRAKTAFYVGTVVRAYRSAIDAYWSKPEGYVADPKLLSELAGISHRDYDTGFYLGGRGGQNALSTTFLREFDMVAVVTSCGADGVVVEQRNRFFEGDTLEGLTPDGEVVVFTLAKMSNSKGAPIKVAPHAKMVVKMPDIRLPVDTMIRKRVKI